MEKLSITLEVSKETHELGEAVAGLVASLKAKNVDGFQITDVATAVAENLAAIMTGISGVEKMGQERKEDPEAFANAAALMGAKILAAATKQQA